MGEAPGETRCFFFLDNPTIFGILPVRCRPPNAAAESKPSALRGWAFPARVWMTARQTKQGDNRLGA